MQGNWDGWRECHNFWKFMNWRSKLHSTSIKFGTALRWRRGSAPRLYRASRAPGSCCTDQFAQPRCWICCSSSLACFAFSRNLSSWAPRSASRPFHPPSPRWHISLRLRPPGPARRSGQTRNTSGVRGSGPVPSGCLLLMRVGAAARQCRNTRSPQRTPSRSHWAEAAMAAPASCSSWESDHRRTPSNTALLCNAEFELLLLFSCWKTNVEVFLIIERDMSSVRPTHLNESHHGMILRMWDDVRSLFVLTSEDTADQLSWRRCQLWARW